jgi:predicted Zn-dependent protease
MIGKTRILTTLRSVISKSAAQQTEAVFIGGYSGTSRFANSTIHQNVAENNTQIIFRSIINGKIGVASTTSLNKDDLYRAMKNSLAIAERALPNPDFKGLPKPATYKKINAFFEPTAAYTPKQRAEVIRDIGRKADKLGMTIAGAFTTSSSEIAVINSNGVDCYQPLTSASLNLIAMSDSSSGYAEGLSRSVLKIPFALITETAFKKCLEGKNPESLEPAKYDVILEPVAVSSLMDWLSMIGFGAKGVVEKTSFLAGKIGKKVMSPELTIYDDGNDVSGLAMPFDFEGVPKKKVDIIKKGIACGPVYDSLYAAKAKTRSTGHAMVPGFSEGPMASNCFISAGKKSKESLIASVKDGLLVTRFFYINGLLDTPRALMTGMTRDGLFRIKNGKVTGPVKNLRFTESITGAFSRIAGISKETQLVKNWWDDIGCCSAPTILIRKFNFSGKTEF